MPIEQSKQWVEVLKLLVTLVPAWVALGLSVYNFLQGLPRRVVKLGFTSMPEGLAQCIVVTFLNERGPKVVINEVGIEYDDGVRHVKIPDRRLSSRLPTEVPPGHSAKYYMTGLRGIIHEREPDPIGIYCKDQANNCYEAKLSRTVWSTLSSG